MEKGSRRKRRTEGEEEIKEKVKEKIEIQKEK